MNRFPLEVLDQIALYLEFEKVISLSDYVAMKMTESLNERETRYYAQTGNFTVLKWLHRHRSSVFTKKTIDTAAEYGHIQVVKWPHENCNENFTMEAMNGAAMNGHLKIIKWLHYKSH